MSTKFPAGLYDLLYTVEVHKRLERTGLLKQAKWAKIDSGELPQRLANALAKELLNFFADELSTVREEDLLLAINQLFDSPKKLIPLLNELRPQAIQTLLHIKSENQFETKQTYPDTPLSISALLTGSSHSPSLRTQIIKELSSADQADWLVSFIRYSGLLPILPALRDFTSTPMQNGKPKLRIATTSYMGATEYKAIEALLELPNTEIRISYDTKRTRLHAKAYIFHRNTGFGSAYIGSANISKAALDDGLEWTAKISQYETDHLWQHAIATFESHWEDDTEFVVCKKEDLPRLKEALLLERSKDIPESDAIPFFDLRPYSYQQVILDDIQDERESGKNHHLVIAATGTGKTMVAAFDYKQYAANSHGLPKMLYIAHREEILNQARGAFRQVLRNGSFGEIIAGGTSPNELNHLFCTVQSWNSKGFDQLDPTLFDYVVLDEAHHASAASYQALINHINPKSLLGLTATPERCDGQDIRNDFGGAFTHEIRLPEAVERALLAPFHYFGIPDLDGLNYSGLDWRRGGYDQTALASMLGTNKARAHWVLSQLERYVNDIQQIRALGFCVSVAHADFMAEFCEANNIKAISLSASSPLGLRRKAQRQLEQREINIIFSVDLYNEGVDIPSVDTVMFLRPTESLTIFLQQLGRGLRLHDEKSHLTVLDFIAPQHRNFSYAKRFRALSSRPERSLVTQIESDMPYLPAGCLVHLEKQAKEHVLQNIKSATNALRGNRLIQELRQLQGTISLEKMLEYLNLDSPDEIYRKGLPHLLLAEAHGLQNSIDMLGYEQSLAKGFRRLLLMDDREIVTAGAEWLKGATSILPDSNLLLQSVLWGNNRPANLNEADRFIDERPGLKNDLIELFSWLLANNIPHSVKRFKEMTGLLSLHASYTREQILLALGLGAFEQPVASREGCFHVRERKLDLFFADINKSEADFSPTTMYEDYALTDKLFHWQSQSQTGAESATGQRYINHREQGYTPLLFIRNRKLLENGLIAPYFFAGPLCYHRHEGSKPISIVWELEYALPARTLSWARRVG
jgi:superfamily II DNA or RNA helicase/HKD family nuclease